MNVNMVFCWKARIEKVAAYFKLDFLPEVKAP